MIFSWYFLWTQLSYLLVSWFFNYLLFQNKKDLSTVEDPFDAPTYNIPEKPVTFVEGASYSVVILAGLGIAAAAGYAVFKELIFEPKEWGDNKPYFIFIVKISYKVVNWIFEFFYITEKWQHCLWQVQDL